MNKELEELKEQLKVISTRIDEIEKKGSETDSLGFYEGEGFCVELSNVYATDEISVIDANSCREAGSVFKKHEQAYDIRKILLKVVKIANIAFQLDPNWRPDWNDGTQVKYFLYFENLTNKWYLSYTFTTCYSLDFYFSEDIKDKMLYYANELKMFD